MKKILFIVFLFLFNFGYGRLIYASSDSINYEYDQCISESYSNFLNTNDGYNEKWYILNNYHIEYTDNGLKEIKYYISPNSKESNDITWFSDINIDLSNRIIDGFIESMEKWNDIYVYVKNHNGLYEKKEGYKYCSRQ